MWNTENSKRYLINATANEKVKEEKNDVTTDDILQNSISVKCQISIQVLEIYIISYNALIFQERFHDAANFAVNMANWFTRMWKYAPEVVGTSEYLIHATLFFGVELTDDIFAFGNCYDAGEYKTYFLFCPYAYR